MPVIPQKRVELTPAQIQRAGKMLALNGMGPGATVFLTAGEARQLARDEGKRSTLVEGLDKWKVPDSTVLILKDGEAREAKEEDFV